MAYQRKTRDYWDILGDYGQGFEVVTAETTWKEARNRLREYRMNEPGTVFKTVKRREKIECPA